MRKEVIGDCTLICADSRDILPTLSGIDACICDPPYGVNLGKHRGAKDFRSTVLTKSGYENYDDTPENFKQIIVPIITIALNIVDRSAIFIAGHSAWMLPMPDAVGGIFIPSAMGRNPWGFASIQHLLFYGAAPDLNLGAKATAIYSTEIADKNGHPCPKPLGWMNWVVSLATRDNETVLDPFMGSGTTGVACVRLRRRFIGIEIDERYFNIACERIQAEYNKIIPTQQPDGKIVRQKHKQVSLLRL